MTKPQSPDRLAAIACHSFDMGLTAMPYTINGVWMAGAKPIVQAIFDSIQKGDFEGARALAATVDLLPAMEALAPKLAGLAKNAVLYGQFFAHSDDGVVTDKKPPDAILSGAVNQLVNFVVTDCAQDVRDRLADCATLAESMSSTVIKSDRLRKSADDALAAALNLAVFGGKKLVDLSASLTTSRLVSYGSLSELRDRGMTTFVWSSVLDTVTCGACQSLHGKEFQVKGALDRIEATFQTNDVDELKRLMPFNSEASAVEGKKLLIPPLHPWCRCICVPKASALALPNIADALARLGLPPPITAPDFGEEQL